MVKLLIKKQLREIFRGWFVNQKTNQRRSKAGVIGFLLLFVVLMVGVLGGIFTVLSFSPPSRGRSRRRAWAGCTFRS